MKIRRSFEEDLANFFNGRDVEDGSKFLDDGKLLMAQFRPDRRTVSPGLGIRATSTIDDIRAGND